jgi:hypothetical protein
MSQHSSRATASMFCAWPIHFSSTYMNSLSTSTDSSVGGGELIRRFRHICCSCFPNPEYTLTRHAHNLWSAAQAECYNSPEFKARNASAPGPVSPTEQAWPQEEIIAICRSRILNEFTSHRIRIAPGPPEKILAVVGVQDAIAGEAFAIQPKCAVLDNYGNLVEGVYEVVAQVRNSRDMGCLCDVSEGEYCIHSMPSPSVQTCEGGICEPGKLGGRNRVATVNGWANFTNLACTKASCSPGCTDLACGEQNCDRFSPYQFTCSIVGGGCAPCTDTTEPFHVYPNKYAKIQPGKLQHDQACFHALFASCQAILRFYRLFKIFFPLHIGSKVFS